MSGPPTPPDDPPQRAMGKQGALQRAMAAIEQQRALLGDEATELALAPLRAQWAQGQAGTGASPPSKLRRAQVTVLFIDIVGSTALASRLDPEDVLQAFGPMLERAAACVRARGGQVLRYTGDGLKAGFGTQGTREDDAEQAVLAGLDIIAASREHAQHLKQTQGVAEFGLRLGAHTGEVVLGAGFESDHTLTGETVNLAARMEQSAPPGTLRISAETYAHVRGLFDVEAQAPLAVKGAALPMQTYLVQRAKPRHFRMATRGIEGVATRMIGRDAEFQVLLAAYEQLFRQRRFAAVHVVGEAGMGKSRLLYEFAAWTSARPERFLLFRGRATLQTATQAYGLLRDLLAWRFRIADDDSLEVARGKLVQAVVPLLLRGPAREDAEALADAEAQAHLLGHLIGIDGRDSPHLQGLLEDPVQVRKRGFEVAAQMFRQLGAHEGEPVILQLEDLHWADEETLDFLLYLAQANQDQPLLVMAFTRPALFERRSDWLAQWHAKAEGPPCIELNPLDRRASRSLAGELLKKLPDVPAALRALLTSNAEGNPFYMEELVKMLIDRGAIETGPPWRVNADRLVLTDVPTTLTGVIQARLDGLPALERRALQVASVIGPVFWEQALAAIDPQLAEQLPALARRQLVLPRADRARDGWREHSFHHHLLQQVTYATVLKTDRQQVHARVAQWLAAQTARGSLRAGDFLGTAAEHFERAGDKANAAEYHARAASQAGPRMAHERVLGHVSRGLALLDEGAGTPPHAAPAELRWRLLSARENTLHLRALREEQAADLDALSALADELNDDQRRAYAAWRRSLRAMRVSDLGLMESAAREAMQAAARAGDHPLRLQALRLLATAWGAQGRIDEGRALALEGLAEVEQLGLPALRSMLFNVLMLAAWRVGDLAGAIDLAQQALQGARDAGDRVSEASSLANVGVTWMLCGHLAQARQDLERALVLSRANGDRVMESSSLARLSTLARWQGELKQAVALARSALEVATAAQARDVQVRSALNLGEALCQTGQLAEARQYLVEAQAGAVDIGYFIQHDTTAALARVALVSGDMTAALQALQPLLQHSAAGGTLVGTDHPRLIELRCHQVLQRAGDPGAAAWLSAGRAALLAQAAAMPHPAWRQALLHNVPHHRELLEAWAEQQAAQAPAVPWATGVAAAQPD